MPQKDKYRQHALQIIYYLNKASILEGIMLKISCESHMLRYFLSNVYPSSYFKTISRLGT